jgi:GAF domain-containing protein
MERNGVLAEFARLADDIGTALQPAGHDELLQSIVSAARELFGAAACSIALLENDDEELVFHVADGAGAESVVGLRMPSSQGIAGWTVRSGQALIVENVREDPRFASGFAQETGYQPTAVLAVPLETSRGILGVLQVLDWRRDDDGRTRELDMVGVFADQAALAIEGALVFRELGRTLLRAVAEKARSGTDIAATLNQVADDRTTASPELARLAAAFASLAEMGDEERDAALDLLEAFGDYARSVRRMR